MKKHKIIKQKNEITIGTKVLITWFDAFGRGSWNDFEDVNQGLKNPILAEIIGYLIKRDKDFVVLSMGIQTDPSAKAFLHLEFIPRGSIKDIKEIK